MDYKKIKNNINRSYQKKLKKCEELYLNIINSEDFTLSQKETLNELLTKETKEFFINKAFLDETLNDLKIRKEREENSKRKGAFDRRNIYEFYVNTYIIANFTEALALFYFNQRGDALFNNCSATHNLEKNQKINSNFDFLFFSNNKKILIEQQTYFDKKSYISIKQSKLDNAKDLYKNHKTGYFLNIYIPETNNYEDLEFSFLSINDILKNHKYEEHKKDNSLFGGKEFAEINQELDWKKNPKSLRLELI